jgi:hypothetical protein
MFIFINMGIKNRTFNLILRRVDPEYLEKEFIECLDITSNHFLNGFRKSGSVMPLATFRNMTISMTIDAIHWYIHSTTPDDLQWYDDVFYALRKYYDERIEDRYDQIKTKYVINESVIKILREENEEKSSIKKQLQNLIDNIGINRAKIAVGGFKNLFRILNINSPMDYLHLFDNIKIIPLSQTEFSDGFFNENDVDCYGYSPDKIIFIHFKDREGEGRISYEEIWEVLREGFGLSYEETRDVTMEWLNSVFDLQVTNTFDDGY